MPYIVAINGLFGTRNYLLKLHGAFYPVGLKGSATKFASKDTATFAALDAGYRSRNYTILKVK